LPNSLVNLLLVWVVALIPSQASVRLCQKPGRRLITDSALERMRLLDGAVAKWARHKCRALAG
jgi:hypothetical protein